MKAQDKDKDGHASSACAAMPGDDCDDSQAAIHPGATETCDGIDNNCNGKIDIDDGLTLSGTNKPFIAGTNLSNAAVAWAPKAGVYGVVWTDSSSTNDTPTHEFAAFDRSGTTTVAEEPVASFTLGSDAAAFPQNISMGDQDFGIAWGTDLSVHFRRVTPGGLLDVTTVDYALQGGFVKQTMVGQVPGGNWILGWIGFSAPNPPTGIIIDSATESKSAEVPLAPTASISQATLAVSGQGAMVAYVNQMGAVWSSSRSTALTTSLGGGQLASPGGNVRIAGTSTSFGVAWNSGSDVVFENLKSNGTALCGPTHLTIASGAPAVTQVIATGSGFLVVFTINSATNTLVVPVTNACKFAVPVSLGLANAAVAGDSTNGYAAVFPAAGLSERRFGPLFCN